MINVLRFATIISSPRPVIKQLIVGLLIIALQVVSGAAYAQDQEKKEKPKTRVTQALDNRLYEKIQKAQQAAEEKDLAGALEILDDLRSGKKLNDYELATVLNIYGYIYFTQENYAKAQETYEEIVSLEKAPEATRLQARYSLAQAYFIAEDYRKGVAALKEWFKESEKPGATAYVLMAQGLHQLKDYDGALKNINTAVKMYLEADKVPPENWYGLQSFLYYQKNDFKQVTNILKELLKYYPQKKYWVQLAAMYSEQKDEKRQLSSMDTAYVQGMLDKEQELVTTASLFITNDAPYKAAKILDKAINDTKIVEATSKHLELLGVSWRQAQEIKKAIPVMARAASKSDKGDLWSQLCGVYLDNDEFEKAVDACDKSLKKGKIKRVDTTWLYKGMAHFNLKQYSEARKAFKEALKDDRSKQYAKQWIDYMNSELERQESLKDV